MNRVEGSVALVTGGSRGIGAAVALRLGEEGADVVLTHESDKERACEVVEQVRATGRRARAVRADSAASEAVAASVDETVAVFGRLDVVVNDAAVHLVGPVEELGAAAIDRTPAVDVRAVFPGLALYSTSETALTGMTEGLARALGRRGIAVNLVHPGPTGTDTDASPADGPNSELIAGFTA